MYALNGKQSYSTLLKIACRRFIPAMRSMLLFVIAYALMSAIIMPLIIMTGNGVIYYLLQVVSYGIQIYLLSCCLMCSHWILQYKSVDLKSIANLVFRRVHRVIAALIIIPIAIIIVIAIIYRLFTLLHGDMNLVHISLLIAGFFSMIVVIQLIMMVFAIPLVLIKDESVFLAIRTSFKITYQYIYKVIALYCFAVFIYVFTMSGSYFSMVLQKYYLWLPYHFIVFSLSLPLFFNVFCVIFADLYFRYLRLEED